MYSYYRTVTIDHTKVSSGPHSNFPVLFNSTIVDLKTVGNGGHVQNSNGYDIIFSSSTSSADKLDFEILKYDGTTGEFVAFFRQPTLNSASDDVIYLLYGDAAIGSSQENITGTWNSNYKAVWHLKEASGTILDSTSNDNDSTSQASLTYQQTGKFGYCITSGGSGTAILGRTNFPTGAIVATLQLWVNGGSQGAQAYMMGYGPVLAANDSAIFYNSGADLLGRLTQVGANIATSTDLLTSTWKKVSCEINGSTAQQLYINGSADTSGAMTFNISASGPSFIFCDNGGGSKFTGSIQEVRVVTALLGAGWETTEWNNQNAADGSFYTVGTESSATTTTTSTSTSTSTTSTSTSTTSTSSSTTSTSTTQTMPWEGEIELVEQQLAHIERDEISSGEEI